MKNFKVYNAIIKNNPQLTKDVLKAPITVIPSILDFENKRNYFRAELKKLRQGNHEPINIMVNRQNIFEDSYDQIKDLSKDELKNRFHIQFVQERGQDAGGLLREWYTELSRQMFDVNRGLFKLSSGGATYYPNPQSYVQPDHLPLFKFIGRILGKAMFDEQYLECYFVRSLYKILAGEPLSWHDVEDFDNEFYNNLKWLLENPVDENFGFYFAEEADFFGRVEVRDLVEGGRDKAVNEENKREYVEKKSFFKLYDSIKAQVDNFLDGFYEMIPRRLATIFDSKELELLISGLPTVNIFDLKENTEYSNYKPRRLFALSVKLPETISRTQTADAVGRWNRQPCFSSFSSLSACFTSRDSRPSWNQPRIDSSMLTASSTRLVRANSFPRRMVDRNSNSFAPWF